MKAPFATFEIQNGFVQRPTHRNTPYDAAMFEVCGHRYADLSEGDYGVALLNDCKYGHSCEGSTLSLSLLRSPKSPDPECDIGIHTFRYGIYPHLGGTINHGKVTRAAANFNFCNHHYPLKNFTSVETQNCDCPIPLDFLIEGLIQVVPEHCGLIIDIAKVAEDESSLILRLSEVEGTRGHARIIFALPGITEALYVSLNERSISPRADLLIERQNDGRASFQIKFGPFEIITVSLKK